MTSTAQAGHMLERARWAAAAYAEYDATAVTAIVHAVAEAAHAEAERFAAEAVAETGMGVVADKATKNRACSRGIVDHYRGEDYVTPRIDAARKIVELPRPAGVVLALTPTTNPVATVYFKTILALMTRNAVVIAPHPRAARCSAGAARVLAEAAVAAGAPDGVVQVVEEPSIPLVQALMADDRTDVIVATGGTGVVRAAYASGNPALGVGPGNVPVFVDASADPAAAATRIVASKAFDNSVLCTNESVLIAEDSIADKLRGALTRAGAHLLDEDGARRLRAYMFADGRLNTDVVGRDAAWIAGQVPASFAGHQRQCDPVFRGGSLPSDRCIACMSSPRKSIIRSAGSNSNDLIRSSSFTALGWQTTSSMPSHTVSGNDRAAMTA